MLPHLACHAAMLPADTVDMGGEAHDQCGHIKSTVRFGGLTQAQKFFT